MYSEYVAIPSEGAASRTNIVRAQQQEDQVETRWRHDLFTRRFPAEYRGRSPRWERILPVLMKQKMPSLRCFPSPTRCAAACRAGAIPARRDGRDARLWEGEAPAELDPAGETRLGGSLALPTIETSRGTSQASAFPARPVRRSLATNAVSGGRTRPGSAASIDYGASDLNQLFCDVLQPKRDRVVGLI